MKVRTVGFQLKFSNNIELPEIYQIIESNQGKEIEHFGDKYIYYTEVRDNYIVGLVLRFNEVKSSIATETDKDGNLVIDISMIGDKKSNTEVSMFSINPVTLRGMYYNYRGSLSSSALKTIWKKPHDIIMKYKIKSLTDEFSQLDINKTKAARKKAIDYCQGKFDIRILSTPATIETLISQFETIEEMTFSSEEALVGAGKYTPPAQTFISSAKITTRFEKVASNLGLVTNYIKSIASNKIQKSDILKLRGKLESGEEKTLAVGENLSEFGLMEFDRFVELLPTGLWSSYNECPALNILMTKIKENTIIFGEQPTNDDWRLSSVTNLEVTNFLKQAS
jgi:hypothetical protein